MKVAIYARVSTSDQTVNPQLDSLRDYVSRRGYEIFQEYIDAGVSGSKESRPALNQLMKDARDLKFKAVIVFRFDRFARSTSHLWKALEEFMHLKIDFISVSEQLDTGSPLGKAMFTMISAMAQLEKDIMVERIRSGIKSAKSRGVHCGRPASAPNSRIKELLAQGMPIKQIAKKLRVGIGTIYRAKAS